MKLLCEECDKNITHYFSEDTIYIKKCNCLKNHLTEEDTIKEGEVLTFEDYKKELRRVILNYDIRNGQRRGR